MPSILKEQKMYKTEIETVAIPERDLLKAVPLKEKWSKNGRMEEKI